MAGLTKEQKIAKALLEKAVELSGLKAEEFNQLSAEEQAAYTTKAQEALDAEALNKADASKKPVDEVVDNSHLITVIKGGETLDVHPTALADHKRMGWKEA
ncbi:hypothetical protein NTD84_03150 [Pseudomonas sp. 14P_8.1_Bac3]|uniref:hypothetical protein n=1 Tax=Pseudomonas sp. 14P_8.1_Bac3 TaxID=2971621 RepID=UPI0021C9F10A|nr:hypothetical protein [Pseudomonas sp. 14P_8.1_Bac3]MCU1758717.1 hypothetical protein [Pseudomonas sp. 14P_8.1_Bac3]